MKEPLSERSDAFYRSKPAILQLFTVSNCLPGDSAENDKLMLKPHQFKLSVKDATKYVRNANIKFIGTLEHHYIVYNIATAGVESRVALGSGHEGNGLVGGRGYGVTVD